MKAIIVTEPKQVALVTDHPIPQLRDDYMLVKPVSVALNPTDWKNIEYFAPPGVTVGCDYAGVVEAVGKDVRREFHIGDRVCGFAHGCNALQPEDGSFAEHIVVKGDVQFKIPEGMSFQEAATLGAGLHTVGQAMYQSLKLALPTEPIKDATPILIYGGSTATGTLAIQFAKLSGYRVLTTCSPHNFDLVRSCGAEVYDYKDAQAAGEIRKVTNNNLKLVLDCIALESSAVFCDNALSTDGGEYGALLNCPISRENVNDRYTLAYSVVGEAYTLGELSFPAYPDDQAHAEMFIPIAESLLVQGKIKVHPPRVGQDGLKGVIDGLRLLKEDKVSGEKLVYNIFDTP